ncbi:MAG: antibiotic biosynthesis monooxygenase [Pseudomonadota bacterium]|nr:antibiotic biosynthesis monooxygenase [Pseudomonadota bacterium]
MNFNVILDVQAKPECADELKATFEAILPDTRSYAGCNEVKVLVNQDDPANLILLEKWQTRADYEAYVAWRSEQGTMELLEALMATAPSIRYYDDLSI